MCISASVSYGAAVVLVSSGLHALYLSLRLKKPYWLIALIPVFFGVQQAFEGRVWQLVASGEARDAVPYALGFLFFSHFFWMGWIPLSSYRVEPEIIRRRIFIGISTTGAIIGAVIILSLFTHPEWLAVVVKEQAIVYKITSPLRGQLSLPVPASAIYALIILVPLLASSHRHLRLFGWLILASVLFASVFYAYAIISVWCLFAALLSLYLVVMIRKLVANAASA